MRRFLMPVLLCYILSGCSTNNVNEDENLKTYFDSAAVKGCFALFNNGENNFTVCNLSRYRDSSYTPAATFDIVNSLIGIQTGAIRDENMVVKWDGIKRGDDEWNRDLTMKEAFAVSSVPYFQEVTRRIGRDTMKIWIDSLGYGNRNMSGPIDSFWINNRLKIKPDEELGLAKKLYFDQLPFFKHTQDIVQSVMLREQNSNYKLSYKTGWGNLENGHEMAWVVGWIEENKHPYFFVLNIETPEPGRVQGVSVKLLREILARLGFFNGKK
ncbi:MAG TPA: penicillin-binding transpeptidase domain-containing protein [Puia sp.]